MELLEAIKPKRLTFGLIGDIIAVERGIMMKNEYSVQVLPLNPELIDLNCFFEELIDASAKLEVYKEKLKDSKVSSSWFMPTLQQKEALASSLLEGTQATLDGVLINEVTPNEKDKNLNEIKNYYVATVRGYEYLKKHDFSDEFFFEMHRTLMDGNVRKPKTVGAFRTKQNFIGRNDQSHAITFIPPDPQKVEPLMDNLIQYMNEANDKLRPLVQIAIIHAQFETIHPFMDGNGRVGRLLIPMYLFSKKQIELPCFFISEALERDKIRYYALLNGIRYENEWNEWIRFFLETVEKQCDKYIEMITEINKLYEQHLEVARELARSSHIVDIMNLLYQHPVTTAKQIAEETDIPLTSINRYLNMLVENKILYSDRKSRNRNYFYFALLDILR